MQKRIALLGEVLVDLIVSEDFTIRPVPGGSIYNTASSLSKLGDKTSFYSHVGNDLWGNYLLEQMSKQGIDYSGISKSSIKKTELAFAVIDKNGNASYDFYKSEFTDKINIGDFSDVGIFHYGSIFSIMSENQGIIKDFIKKSKGANALISYDPNFRKSFSHMIKNVLENLKSANIIKASIEDLENVFGVKTLDEAFTCVEKYNPILIIITLGDKGVASKIHGRNYVKLDALKVNIIDTIGAGDNFSTGYLCYLYEKGIFTKDQLSKIDDDFILKMLTFANNVACEVLKVKGAGIEKDKLLKIKETLH